MKLNIKLSEGAVAPVRGSKLAAGYDLVALSKERVIKLVDGLPVEYIEYNTGVAIQLPETHVGLIFPRSSVRNTKLSLANCVGVIDADYIGEIKASFKETSLNGKMYGVGERVCQLLVMPTEQLEFNIVDKLKKTERGSNGHGSTGK